MSVFSLFSLNRQIETLPVLCYLKIVWELSLRRFKVNTSVMVLGVKETFIIRVLVKKLNDAGMKAAFVPAKVNDINAQWDNHCLVVYYMEQHEAVPGDVVSFLNDKLTDTERQILLIGDPDDTSKLVNRMPGELINRVFTRPLDNDAFVKHTGELLDKIAEGEFKKRILIVDDDPTYLSLIRDWLKEDYKVTMANSGLQAIKWLGKNTVDLILLDHEMPITTGPQVLEMLRSEDETKKIPVIFLTGKGDKASVMQVVALKPEGYFLKTVKRNELLEKLDEFFASRK